MDLRYREALQRHLKTESAEYSSWPSSAARKGLQIAPFHFPLRHAMLVRPRMQHKSGVCHCNPKSMSGILETPRLMSYSVPILCCLSSRNLIE